MTTAPEARRELIRLSTERLEARRNGDVPQFRRPAPVETTRQMRLPIGQDTLSGGTLLAWFRGSGRRSASDRILSEPVARPAIPYERGVTIPIASSTVSERNGGPAEPASESAPPSPTGPRRLDCCSGSPSTPTGSPRG